VSEINVRRAHPGDADFLVYGNASMAYETEQITLDPERLASGVRALLADPSKGFYVVAEIGGRQAGQMMITYEWSDWRNGTFWWIQSVFVAPEFRNRGVFKALYRHIEEEARREGGVCGLRLYVESENERAQRTYLNVGMRRARYDFFEVDYVIPRP